MKKVVGLLLGLLVAVPCAWPVNKAGIVIQNSTGELITRCVEFEEPVITVETLLNRSGFTLITEDTAFGALLHFLHDDGVADKTPHPAGWFWNFFLHETNAWVAAPFGISTATATDGTLFGFGFGAWGEVQLPERTFADVCKIKSKAGLVIDHSDGHRVVRVVEFPGETITGLQLLQRSGLDLVTRDTAFGTAICAIDGEGQPQDECFGDPQGRFWNFNILDADETWSSSPVGVDASIVRDRDVHGFLFGVFGTVQPSIRKAEVFELPSGVNFWGAYWK